MATLISAATGNQTSAATWGLVDATSFLNSEASNTALTTSMVASSAFTPGAITIDGIAVKIASRAAVPSGSITIELAQAGVRVTGAFCTINVADLSLCTTTDLAGGWVFFKFAAPVTLAAATAYTVRALTSSATQVNLFRDATAANWSRALRTTTTSAPTTGTDMIVIGELTGAGTGNDITVTMDSTAATDYGSNVTGAPGLISPALAVGKRGTLTCGTTASTNYILRLSGNCIIYAGGLMNMGTVATQIPRNSTAWLEFDCTTALDFGLTIRNLGTYIHQGLSRTSGKDIWSCLLNTNAAINATTLGVDTDTGWLDNDAIAVATTTQTKTQSERGALNGAAGASSLTVDTFLGTGGGVAAAHSGTSPTQAEVGLLTRNTGVRSVSSSATSFIAARETATADMKWVELYNLGSGSSRALTLFTTTGGAFSLQYFSMHDVLSGTITESGNACDNITLRYGVIWGPTSGAAGTDFVIPASTLGANCTHASLWHFRSEAGLTFQIRDLGGTISDLRAMGGGGTAFDIADGVATGTCAGLVAHGNNGVPFQIGTIRGVTLTNLKGWRNTSGMGVNADYCSVDTLLLFGNSGTNLLISGFMRGKDFTLAGDTTFPAQGGIVLNDGQCVIDGLDSGVVTGIFAAHTTSDVTVQALTGRSNAILNNAALASATQVGSGSSAFLKEGYGIKVTRLGKVDGVNKSWLRNGIIQADQTIFRTAAPSERISPGCQNTFEKCPSGPIGAMCDKGSTKTIEVYVWKDAAYVDAQPRLMLRANAAMGVAADTVLATMAGGSGAFERLAGTTPVALDNGVFEAYVDCGGVAGNIYVEDRASS